MQKINALQLRQSMGKIIARLEKSKEPVLLEKGRRPVAVLITLEDYKKRFSDQDANDRRKAVIERIKGLARPGTGKRSADIVLRSLRGERER